MRRVDTVSCIFFSNNDVAWNSRGSCTEQRYTIRKKTHVSKKRLIHGSRGGFREHDVGNDDQLTPTPLSVRSQSGLAFTDSPLFVSIC